MVDDVVVQYNYYHELRGLLQKKTARLAMMAPASVSKTNSSTSGHCGSDFFA